MDSIFSAYTIQHATTSTWKCPANLNTFTSKYLNLTLLSKVTSKVEFNPSTQLNRWHGMPRALLHFQLIVQIPWLENPYKWGRIQFFQVKDSTDPVVVHWRTELLYSSKISTVHVKLVLPVLKRKQWLMTRELGGFGINHIALNKISESVKKNKKQTKLSKK